MRGSIKKEEPNIIYSSSDNHQGRVKRKKEKAAQEVRPNEITLELKRVKAKRGGKFVIVISNLPKNSEFNKKLAKDIKKFCACGGTYKDEVIEVQGDKYELVSQKLIELGFKVKKIGG